MHESSFRTDRSSEAQDRVLTRPELVRELGHWAGYVHELDALAGALDLSDPETYQLFHETRAGMLRAMDVLHEALESGV